MFVSMAEPMLLDGVQSFFRVHSSLLTILWTSPRLDEENPPGIG